MTMTTIPRARTELDILTENHPVPWRVIEGPNKIMLLDARDMFIITLPDRYSANRIIEAAQRIADLELALGAMMRKVGNYEDADGRPQSPEAVVAEAVLEKTIERGTEDFARQTLRSYKES